MSKKVCQVRNTTVQATYKILKSEQGTLSTIEVISVNRFLIYNQFSFGYPIRWNTIPWFLTRNLPRFHCDLSRIYHIGYVLPVFIPSYIHAFVNGTVCLPGTKLGHGEVPHSGSSSTGWFNVAHEPLWCSYDPKDWLGMRLTSSSWGISAANPTFSTRTYTREAKATESSSSTSGSIRPRPSTPTPFYGIHQTSCMYHAIDISSSNHSSTDGMCIGVVHGSIRKNFSNRIKLNIRFEFNLTYQVWIMSILP